MPDLSLLISVGNLAEGFCPSTEQQRLNGYAAALGVTFPFSSATINTGNSAPSADNRVFPWFRSNADGTPDKWYLFVNGYWISKHPIDASDISYRIYPGTLASIDTYDGGEVAAVTSTTGPMWEAVTDMNDRFPIGVSATYPYNTTGGEATVALVEANTPPHQHIVPTATTSTATIASQTTAIDYGSTPAPNGRPCAPGGVIATAVWPLTSTLAAATPHNNIPPYKAVYFIRRTARAYYRL